MGCCGGDDTDTGVRRKGCTDVLCLALFFIFWIILGMISGIGWYMGEPVRFIYGFDSFGNTCGRNNAPNNLSIFSGRDFTDRPYVFFLDDKNLRKSTTICVRKCPDVDIVDATTLAAFTKRTNSSLCRYDVEQKGLQEAKKTFNVRMHRLLDADAEKQDPCPAFPILQSKPIVNRCIPVNLLNLGEGVIQSVYDYFNSIDTFKQVVADLMLTWREILQMTGFSLLVTIVVVFLIHFLADVVAWILLVVVSLSLVILTGLMWWAYIELKYKADSPWTVADILEEKYRTEKNFLYGSIVSTVVTVIMLLICLVMRKRVNLVVALFNEAGRCIRSMPGLLMQPLWTFISLIIFVFLWGAIILGISSINFHQPDFNNMTFDKDHPFDDFISPTGSNTNETTYLTYAKFGVCAIAFFWASEFILGCQQMVIAGAVGHWYFTRKKSTLVCPVGKSICRLIGYHMGTIAMGSFLLTLLKIPRLILVYLNAKLDKHKEYAIVKGILYCLSCCLWALHKFLEYLSRNAYSITAIKGTPFCTSARIAFNTIASNMLRVGTINSVGDFILFLGKLLVVICTGVVATILLNTNRPELMGSALAFAIPYRDKESIQVYSVPLILISILSFFVAHCVLSVYEMVIDTLFMCFCQDAAHNDGSPGKEPYASATLRKLMTSDNEEILMGDKNRARQPRSSLQ